MYTREQLEAMDDGQLNRAVWDLEANLRRDPVFSWLTGDGMLALMEWCNARNLEVTLYNSTFSTSFRGWAATIENPGRHEMIDTGWMPSAPRALAIAVVLAVQGQERSNT